MAKEIPLTQGKVAIVDDEDYEELVKHSWHVTAQGYAARRVTISYYNSTIVSMHRTVMCYEGDLLVDHINGDKLDNRKENLRLATVAQNVMNSAKRSGVYKGVSRSSKNRYRSRLTYKGKELNLGVFESSHDAARMYNFWAHDLFGEYATLNKISEGLND
jgi:two-component SAPR family response regulator